MAVCELCMTEIKTGEDIQPMNGGLYYAHRECLLRNVMGGIGHLRDHNYWCNEMGDPDGGMSFRESALAVDEWVHDRFVVQGLTPEDVDDECECPVCNPAVKAREKVDMTCPQTGLGFIGPQREQDSPDVR